MINDNRVPRVSVLSRSPAKNRPIKSGNPERLWATYAGDAFPLGRPSDTTSMSLSPCRNGRTEAGNRVAEVLRAAFGANVFGPTLPTVYRVPTTAGISSPSLQTAVIVVAGELEILIFYSIA